MGDGPDKRYNEREIVRETCYNGYAFSRLDFIQDYTLKSLRLKQDKWNKLVLSDGQREYILSFIEKGEKPIIMDLTWFIIPPSPRSSSRADHLSEYWRSTSGHLSGKLLLLEEIFFMFRFTRTGRVLSATKVFSSSRGKPSRYRRITSQLWITLRAVTSTPTPSVINIFLFGSVRSSRSHNVRPFVHSSVQFKFV